MKRILLSTAILSLLSVSAYADIGQAINQNGAILSDADASKLAAFDILAAHVHRDGRTVVFSMTTNGVAGSEIPEPAGALGGAPVLSYVWPISLDPSAVGFESETGILALAATSHPDFDDTPLFDENADGDPGNDGAKWHSHWVVLTPTDACGEGALGVRDIAEGTTPEMPSNWPGLPIFLDSPGFSPLFDGPEISIQVAFASEATAAGVSFDGVTSALRVNANVQAPLLCITEVFDIASGDLSLPGVIE